MATFASTVLTKRTGATTTTFAPSGVGAGVGYLRDASATYSLFGAYLTMSQVYQGNARRTRVRATVPQISDDGRSIVSRPWAEVQLWVPEGTLLTDVNDLVGYVNAATADTLTNLDDLLVGGEGVYS